MIFDLNGIDAEFLAHVENMGSQTRALWEIKQALKHGTVPAIVSVNGIAVFANEGLCDLFKYRKEAIEGKSVPDLPYMTPDSREVFYSTYKSTLIRPSQTLGSLRDSTGKIIVTDRLITSVMKDGQIIRAARLIPLLAGMLLSILASTDMDLFTSLLLSAID